MPEQTFRWLFTSSSSGPFQGERFAKALRTRLSDESQAEIEDSDELEDAMLNEKESDDCDESENLAAADLWSVLHRAA
jgi:hypothetical protein